MEKYDWEANIRMNIFLLRMMGFWPKGNTYKLDFYTIYSSILVTLFILGHIFFQVVNVYFIRNNLEALAATSYILLVELLGAFKAYYLIKNMTVLKEIVALLGNELFQPRSSQQRVLIEPGIHFWKTIYKIFLAMCCGSNAFWAVFPFLDRSSPEERRLPFLGWYPYDAKASPFYEFTYVYQIVGISYMTLIHVNVDTLIAAFNVYTGSQLDMLCDSLRNLVGEEDGLDADSKLRQCVEHHKQILWFIERTSGFFNWILFLQFFISGVSIGITMFQLTLVAPLSSEFYSLLSYGIAIILQIFMYCWFGNEVQVKSINVPYAVFQSDWTGLSQETKKKLIFFTMNLMKPVKLSALNLFYLSLETFMRILKTAWSYFTLLNQVNSQT